MNNILMITLKQPSQQLINLFFFGLNILSIIQCLIGHGLINLNYLLSIPKHLSHTILHQPNSFAYLFCHIIKTIVLSVSLFGFDNFWKIHANNIHIQEQITSFAVIFHILCFVIVYFLSFLFDITTHQISLWIFGLWELLDCIVIILILLEVLFLHQNCFEWMGDDHLDCEREYKEKHKFCHAFRSSD